MLAAKILFNSVISTDGAHFMTMEIAISTSTLFSNALNSSACNSVTSLRKSSKSTSSMTFSNMTTVDIKIMLGIHGLPHAGLIANELVNHLNTHGYHQNKHIPGLWKHN
ncbi:hypothetical protein ACHAW6_008281 [Cyclotella cf. meneghiniana]